MQEYERAILERYDMNISSTRKTRGAVLVEAEEGQFLLKEVGSAQARISILAEFYKHLKQQGFLAVDEMITNKDGEYITAMEDGSRYIVKKWFMARECDVRKPAELLEAAANLAKLHIVMKKELPGDPGTAEDLQEEYLRHNRELKKVRKFIRGQTVKATFEYEFLKCFEQMYQRADWANELLVQSKYKELLEESKANFSLVHGEYNYHNVLVLDEKEPRLKMATTNFDKIKYNIQVEDLYYFLRKTMEKYGWKSRLGDNLLNVYSAICPIRDSEMEYLKIRFLYPEKFWKIANAYYRSNKAWISVKNVQKLETAICQTREKERFMEQVFSFTQNP